MTDMSALEAEAPVLMSMILNSTRLVRDPEIKLICPQTAKNEEGCGYITASCAHGDAIKVVMGAHLAYTLLKQPTYYNVFSCPDCHLNYAFAKYSGVEGVGCPDCGKRITVNVPLTDACCKLLVQSITSA